MTRQVVAFGLAVTSIALVIAGVAMIYPPAAFIVGGVTVGVLLFVDVDRLWRRA